MIMKSVTYTSMSVECDAKVIVGISFFVQRFYKDELYRYCFINFDISMY